MAQLNSLLVTGDSRFLNPINGNARNGIYYVKGTQTAATGAWTGNIPVPALYDGLTICYYLPYAGSGNATLNLTLSTGVTTGAKNCYYQGNTRLTTHYGVASSITMTYHPAGSISVNGTATTDDRWIAGQNYIDGNDGAYYDRIIYPRFVAGANKIFPYTIMCQLPDGRWESIVTSASASRGKAKNANGFLLGQIALMYANATYNENAVIESYNAWWRYGSLIDHRYTFNTEANATYGTTANKPVYLVGTIGNDGLFYLADTWWAQSLPTSADNKIYIYIGDAFDTYRMTFDGRGKMYRCSNGAIREFTQDASTVNGLIVQTAVPSGALFTDTQSNWNETSTTSKAYIQNKPTIPTVTDTYSATSSNAMSGKAVASALGTLDGTVSGSAGSSKTLTAFSQTDGKVSATFGNISITKSQVSDFPTIDTTVTSGSSNLVTSGAVYTAIDNLPEPMVFKGTLGTGGTITSLPTASSANEGFTYKVITAGTYASTSAKVGDVFVSNGSSWVLIPSGDTDSNTWRNIKVNGTEKLTTAISSGAVDFVNGTGTTASFTTSGSKVAYNVTYGTTANTACQGNDSRLSDARTPTSHTHGNIQNGGTLQTTDVTIANGDKLVITDSSDSSKVARASIAFDGSTTTKALTQKGTFETFAASSHTHGNVQNGGTLQTNDITIANGDKLVVTDSSDSNKIARTSVSFDGSTTTKALTQKGTFETFATTNTDRYVNQANFDYDSTNDEVKMTLTRAGSDSATVVANIPKVNDTRAGTVPKGNYVSTFNQSTKFLREDGTWQAPKYTTNTVNTLRPTYSNFKNGERINQYSLFMKQQVIGGTTISDYYSSFTSTSGTGTSKESIGILFDVFSEKLYYYNSGTDVTTIGNAIANNTVVEATDLVDMRYTLNITTSSFTANKPVYLISTLVENELSDGRWGSAPNNYTQDPIAYIQNKYNPNLLFIYVGMAYDGYRVNLAVNNPVYVIRGAGYNSTERTLVRWNTVFNSEQTSEHSGDSVNVPSSTSTYTLLDYIELPVAGTYLVMATGYFTSNSSKSRAIMVTDEEGSTSAIGLYARASCAACDFMATALQVTFLYSINTDKKKLYLYARQNSGTALQTQPRFQAIRLY